MDKTGGENRAGKETGAARVYGILRDEILRIHLAPGTPLDEISLAERFDMSRSPIREALVRLSADGLVTILPNRSTVVTPMDFRRVPEFLDALDLLQRVVTRLAAMHRSEQDMVEIRATQLAYEKAVASSIKSGDSLIMINANREFHMAIAKAGRNHYFAELYQRLLDEGRRMLHLHFEYEALDPELTVEKMAGGHTEMVAAIENKDADLAEECAHEHAMQFKGQFLQFLDRNLTAGIPLDYASRSAAKVRKAAVSNV